MFQTTTTKYFRSCARSLERDALGTITHTAQVKPNGERNTETDQERTDMRTNGYKR